MKKAWLALAFGSALFLAACGDDGDSTAKDESASDDGIDAEEIVQSTCTTCHGGNLEGMGSTPSLKDVGSRLTKDEIHDVIVNGRGGMPAGLISDEEEVNAVAEWLSQQK